MKTILLEKAFQTNEYSECPTHIRLTLDEKEIETIKFHQEYAKTHRVVVEVEIGSIELFNDEECEDENDFRYEGECIKVHPESLYFYAQNKWDASDAFESEPFNISMLENQLTIVQP